MADLLERLTAPLPRPVVFIGGPLLYLLLLAFFVFLRFPYDRLADRVEAAVQAASGMEVVIGELGPHLGLLGPGFEARGVSLMPPRGARIPLEHLRLRPAWSLSWLRGVPAVHVDALGEVGHIAGAFAFGDEGPRGFDGWLEQVDSGSPLLRSLLPVDGLTGLLDADVDLEIGEQGAIGEIHFEIGEGSLALPGIPVAIPFERAEGDISLGGEQWASIRDVRLEGPMVSGQLRGTIGRGGRGLDSAPLALDLDLQLRDMSLRSMLQGTGLRWDAEGRGRLAIGGTVARPRPRPG